MGYGLSVLRIDFRMLLGVPGSRNKTLLQQVEGIVRELDTEFESRREEWVVSPSEALQRIFDGTIPTDGVPGSPYVAALLPLYARLGVQIGQINFSSGEIGLVAQWDQALSAAGYRPAFSELCSRGAPFPLPEVVPFDIGFLTPEEVEFCYVKSRGERTWLFGWRRSPPQPQMDPSTFAMLCSWLKEAFERGQGLVGILA